MTDPQIDYDRWNLLMELDRLNSNAVLWQYTWGLDLSGQNGNPSVGGRVAHVGLLTWGLDSERW